MDKINKNKKVDCATKEPSHTNMTDLKFAQINLLHCKRATYTHCSDLKSEQTNISLIQEPWIRGNIFHGFRQLHDRLFYCKLKGKPRAAIYVAPGLEPFMLNQFVDGDLVVVRVSRKEEEGGDFIVISAYMPHDSAEPPPGPLMEKVVEYCRNEGIPMIVGADTNAHHTQWGSSDVNRRGESLLQFLATTDLMTLNRGRRPTFKNAVRSEVLDVTLASSDLWPLVHSWKVADEETFSDHRLIKFCLRGHFPGREPYRNPRRTDWAGFRTLLRSRLEKGMFRDRYSTVEQLELANVTLTAALLEAYELSCPLITPRPMYRNSRWSKELAEKKKMLRKTWNRAGKENSRQEENKAIHRALLKDYKRAHEEIKEKQKAKFFEEADNIPAFARVHKILAKDPAVQAGSLIRPD